MDDVDPELKEILNNMKALDDDKKIAD